MTATADRTRERQDTDLGMLAPTNGNGVACNGKPVERRRLLGAYYTPVDLAEILADWALAQATGSILDPSFGGCAFLNAAARVLRGKGIRSPGRLVYGVDIDPSCVDYVRSSCDLRPDHCIISDFLEVSLRDVGGALFEAIVGNPPYVRHHWLKGSTRSAARALMQDSPIQLPATASTWAYFIVHALGFLRPGGRLAMLVPEAILQADYAFPIREALAARFSKVALIHIRDRLFEGTDEPVVVVAGSGFGKPGKVTIQAVESAFDLVQALQGGAPATSSRRATVANGRSINRRTLALLEEFEKSELFQPLGDLLTARIGIVTGANRHFIRSSRELNELGIPSKARVPVVSRTTWLSGLEFTALDHARLSKAERSAHLVLPTPAVESHEGVVRWIAEGIEAGVEERVKCAERAPWYRVALPCSSPDAFATCTRLGSPLLVLNRPGYQCTNALYAAYWMSDTVPEAVAVGFLTSAVSVWAELHGRRYGGGVLKLDLGVLGRALVPVVPTAQRVFTEIDALFRSGREPEARELADRVVLIEGCGLAASDVGRLQCARAELVAQRVPAERSNRGQ